MTRTWSVAAAAALAGGALVLSAAVDSDAVWFDGATIGSVHTERLHALAAAEMRMKCGGGPTDDAIPAMAYLLNGEVVYVGDMPGEAGPARARFDRTPIAALGDVETEFELLCWNQAAALLGIEVRGGAFSLWTVPGPIDRMRAQLEEIEAELRAGFEESGAYTIDPDDWPAASPGVALRFDVDVDGYTVSASHPRVNRVLFIVSSPDATVPGHVRPETPSDRPGVRSFTKHPAPPLSP